MCKIHHECCSYCSVFHLLEAILEEEEGGALVFLLLLVSEAEGTLVVHLLSDEQLHLGELAGNELDELGGTLLEFRNTFRLALFVELGDNFLHVASAPLHEFGLGEALNFVELELILNINHGLSFTLVLFLFVGGNIDGLMTLCDVLGLGLDAGAVHGDLVGERVREEFIS